MTALLGCGTGDREPLPDWTAGFEDPSDGTPKDPGPIEGPLRLEAASDVGLAMRLTRTGTNDPCAVGISDTINNFQIIECTLDIAEFDLYLGGLHFDLSVPSGACDWMYWDHYMYQAWETKLGPEQVSYNKDPVSGNIIDEVNSIQGVPFCEYDHTDEGGPNCCLGEYTLSVDGTVIGTQSWGGEPAECYRGAAYLDPDGQTTDEGWPATPYVQLEKEAYFRRFSFPPLADVSQFNVGYANYYDPANHGGGPPSGLSSDAHALVPGQDSQIQHYTFTCSDTAQEKYSTIRLIVREWNEEAEFEANGNPDTDGQEPSGGPVDDIADWATAAPDPLTFVKDG